MSFGENLQYFRRRDGITQETLAERFGVSRQTVSKWESDGAFPEMDKLILMCEMFGVTMDDMVRGSVAEDVSEPDIPENESESGMNEICKPDSDTSIISKEEYVRRYKSCATKIVAGAVTILSGIAAMLILCTLVNSDIIPWIGITLSVAVGTILCVSGKLSYDRLIKTTPEIAFDFTAEEYAVADTGTSWQLAAGAIMAVLDVILLTVIRAVFPEASTHDMLESQIVGLFLVILAEAVGLILWAMSMKDMYRFARSRNSGEEKWINTSELFGMIMLIASAVYVALGFGLGLWDSGWIVIVLGCVVCAAFSKIKTIKYFISV